MTKRIWIALLCVFVASSIVEAQQPNIVLVMADDQGWGDMAYNGHPNVKTPNFDAAAATGLRFDRFYAAAPVCSPTRASVMTGRHPNRMGVFKWGFPMRPQETTIAEALKTAGYSTGHFGKWHLGSVRSKSPASPGNNGFDEWYSAVNFYDNNSILSHKGKAVPSEGESSMVAVDAAMQWMETVKDKPFLAVVWFGSPHKPHRAAEEDRALYDDLPKDIQHFLGEVTGMDRAFGKLRDGLTKLGVRENTVLWYCSDNGALPKLGWTAGHRGHKGKVYDGGLLVPAILEWPAKIKSPATTDVRCNTSDIYPTVLNMAGVTVEKQPVLDGIDLSPLVNGEKFARRKPMGFWDRKANGISTPSDKWMKELYEAQQQGKDLPPHESSLRAAELPSPPYSTSTFPGHAALIDGDWKLHRIENAKGNVKWELYDLKNDRSESTDLASERGEIVEAIQPQISEWLKSVTNSLNGADY